MWVKTGPLRGGVATNDPIASKTDGPRQNNETFLEVDEGINPKPRNE